MVHLFLCYSPILHKELKDLGERYVIHAIHPKTRKEFWFSLVLVAVVGMMTVMTGCSSDDDFEDVPLPSIVGDGWVTADESGSDAIKVRFRLTRSDGTPANTFRVCENIVCDLQIINETNDTIFIGEGTGDVVLGHSRLFAVYRSDGSYVGGPYDNNIDIHANLILLVSHKDKKETRIRIPLFEKDESIDSGISSPYFLENWKALSGLPRGVYYMEFPISYNTTLTRPTSPLPVYFPGLEEENMKEVVFKVMFKVK